MLIYEGVSNTPSGGVAEYKSTRKRKGASIQAKASKVSRRTKRRRTTSKKTVKKSKKRTTKKRRTLNAKNKNFLKTLGFRVRRNK